jgi:hypothetical protein
MDEPLLSLFIFIVVVIFYLHLVAQWKKSEDLEIYETDYSTLSQLQEVCDIRQPVLFVFRQPTPLYQSIQFALFDKFSSVPVKIKDIHDYRNPNIETVDSIELPLASARRLMNADTTSRYISEGNEAFLEDTGLSKPIFSMDVYLKPYALLYSGADVIFGSKNAHTPLRYHTNSEYFIVPTAGKISVKMTPWKSRNYLYPVKDYDNYEFWSRVNVWKPDPVHSTEMEKLRFLEFDVLPGHILFIPPYWWYSIRFSSDPNTCVCTFTYDTVINALANSYDWTMYYLQQNNISTRISSASDTTKVSSMLEIPIPAIDSPNNGSSEFVINQDPTAIPESTKPVVMTNMGEYH